MKHFVEFIFSLLQSSQHYSKIIFLIFFLLAYLDSIAFFGLLIPGTWIVISTGIFVINTSLNISLSIFFLVLGAFSSDTTSFFLGKLFAQKLSFLLIKYPSAIRKGESFFKKYGGVSILLGRFIGPLRPVVPFVSGMFNFSSYKFITIDLISSVISIFTFFTIGILIGKSIVEIKSLDPKLLLLVLIFFLIVFIIVKILLKMIMKIEDLGCLLLTKFENILNRTSLIKKEWLKLIYDNPFLSFVILLVLFIPTLHYLLIQYKNFIDLELISLICGFQFILKWSWIFFDFLHKNYTIGALVIAPVFLFYFLVSKKHMLCWIFCIIFILFLSVLLGQGLFWKFFKSSIIIFSLYSLVFFYFYQRKISIDIFFFLMILGFILSVSDINCLTPSQILICNVSGFYGFSIFFLSLIYNSFQNQEYRYLISNLFVLTLVCILIYSNGFNKRKYEERFDLYVENLRRNLVSDQRFLREKRIFCVKICTDQKTISKYLIMNGWKKYDLSQFFKKPLSKEKLILLFDDARSFFSYFWYGYYPDMSFIKQDKKAKFLIKFWKEEDSRYLAIIWSNLKNLKKTEDMISKEFKGGLRVFEKIFEHSQKIGKE